MSDRLRGIKLLALRCKGFLRHFQRLDRHTVARMYLEGDGIEIGALHSPVLVSRKARVRYLDLMDVSDLRRKEYLDFNPDHIGRVDIVDDGETLGTVQSGSLDFVIASHFWEHCQNPVGAFENFLRVLRPGGILFLEIPDKRFTFDRDRPVTSVDHVIRDYTEGPASSRREHLVEWFSVIENQSGEDARKTAEKKEAEVVDIHYHVWTQKEMMELLLYLRGLFPFEMELALRQEADSIFILRKIVP